MRLLIVEDDVALREAIRASAANWAIVVRDPHEREAHFTQIAEASTVAECITHLATPCDVLIVDVRLREESGLRVVEHARQSKTLPLILAMSGQATAQEAFQLATLGVGAYLGKPFDMRELRASIQGLFESPPDLAASAMAQVGHRQIHVVQDEVKSAMLRRALALEDGNITRAARRLGVTRTAVQQMLDRYGLPRPRESR
jgi:two-component system response regulator RegA